MNEYDPTAKCPKCGHELVSTKYHDGKRCIERKCARCGYEWDEAPPKEKKQ